MDKLNFVVCKGFDLLLLLSEFLLVSNDELVHAVPHLLHLRRGFFAKGEYVPLGRRVISDWTVNRNVLFVDVHFESSIVFAVVAFPFLSEFLILGAYGARGTVVVC